MLARGYHYYNYGVILPDTMFIISLFLGTQDGPEMLKKGRRRDSALLRHLCVGNKYAHFQSTLFSPVCYALTRAGHRSPGSFRQAKMVI